MCMSNIKSGAMFDYYEYQAVTVVHVVSVQSFQLASACRPYRVSRLKQVSMAGCQRFLVCGCGLKKITTSSSIYSFI